MPFSMNDGIDYDQEQFVKDCYMIAKHAGRVVVDNPIVRYAYWGPEIKISAGSREAHVSVTYQGTTYYPSSVIGKTSFTGIPFDLKTIVLHTAALVEDNNKVLMS
jgi:hypothetical protein